MFAHAAEQPDQLIELDSHAGPMDRGWESGFDSPVSSSMEPAPEEEEDLTWLRNLEETAKKTGDLKAPKLDTDWTATLETPATPSQPASSQEDLRWLDRLGGIEEPSPTAPEQPASTKPDLSWLDQYSGRTEASQAPQPGPNQPAPPQPFAGGEDLDWLNKLGESAEAAQPAQTSSPEQPLSEDLSWLNDLGKPSPSSKAPAPNEDLGWLNELGGSAEPLSVPPFAGDNLPGEQDTPRKTAPLDRQVPEETEPDWLKRATEAPSMPAPGDLSMDWFSEVSQPEKEKTPSPTPQAAPFNMDIFSTPGEPAPLSNQEVDSLFSVEMPDWLSRPEPGTVEAKSQEAAAAPAGGDDSLAPVDLPSWVQAMRPVEAVISESTPGVGDEPAETEGPLAGLHGVLPIAPIGSSRRPKAVSLTLQASEEQQASALLLEQILGSETSPRSLVAPTVVASQQWLRWVLTGLFLVVLSLVILLRSEVMPISADLPAQASGLTNAVLSIPSGGNVLVVIDYEPSLAGELEAAGGPLLYQMVLLSQPNLSFLSTSPNGPALVERLIANAGIDPSTAQYRNLGLLPGGSAGILGFIGSPAQIIPGAQAGSFSEYAALIVLTDNAESGRAWVEQLQVLGNYPPLLAIASAQAGPMLQPYVSSGQITGMISGVAEAARYQVKNNLPSGAGAARSYWDAFGIGLMLAVLFIIVGSLWSLITGLRARTANADQR